MSSWVVRDRFFPDSYPTFMLTCLAQVLGILFGLSTATLRSCNETCADGVGDCCEVIEGNIFVSCCVLHPPY